MSEGTESADDEDDELGTDRDKQLRRSSKPLLGKPVLPSSKLGIEMMRANSHDSVTVGSESTSEAVTQVATTPSMEMEAGILDGGPNDAPSMHTPPDAGAKMKAKEDEDTSVDATPRPPSSMRVDQENMDGGEEEATPRALGR